MKADLKFYTQIKVEFYDQENLQYVNGIDVPFDEPKNPALTLSSTDNGKNPEKIIGFCRENGIFPLQ